MEMALATPERYALIEDDASPVTLVWDAWPARDAAPPGWQTRVFARASEAIFWAASQADALDFWHPQLWDTSGNQLTFGLEFEELVAGHASSKAVLLTTVA